MKFFRFGADTTNTRSGWVGYAYFNGNSVQDIKPQKYILPMPLQDIT